MEKASLPASPKPLLALIFSNTGDCLSIYDDAWAFTELGKVQIARASHVEPDAAGNWLADLSPVGGPVLSPFVLRSDALAAERDWLNRNLHCLTRATES